MVDRRFTAGVVLVGAAWEVDGGSCVDDGGCAATFRLSSSDESDELASNSASSESISRSMVLACSNFVAWLLVGVGAFAEPVEPASAKSLLVLLLSAPAAAPFPGGAAAAVTATAPTTGKLFNLTTIASNSCTALLTLATIAASAPFSVVAEFKAATVRKEKHRVLLDRTHAGFM
jgi:hypothetical protein